MLSRDFSPVALKLLHFLHFLSVFLSMKNVLRFLQCHHATIDFASLECQHAKHWKIEKMFPQRILAKTNGVLV